MEVHAPPWETNHNKEIQDFLGGGVAKVCVSICQVLPLIEVDKKVYCTVSTFYFYSFMNACHEEGSEKVGSICEVISSYSLWTALLNKS